QLWPVLDARRESRTRIGTAKRAAGLVGWVTRRHVGVTAAGLALMVMAGIGVSRLETSGKLLNLFSPDSRIIQDYSWLEKHLGPLVPIEIVVRFDKDSPLTMIQKLELVSEVEQELQKIEAVGGTISAATFGPNLDAGDGASGL